MLKQRQLDRTPRNQFQLVFEKHRSKKEQDCNLILILIKFNEIRFSVFLAVRSFIFFFVRLVVCFIYLFFSAKFFFAFFHEKYFFCCLLSRTKPFKFFPLFFCLHILVFSVCELYTLYYFYFLVSDNRWIN